MRKLPYLRFLMVLSMLAMSTAVSSYYFFDQGLQTAVVRTDYNATNEGTSANPISMADGDVLYPCSDYPLLLIFPCIEPDYLPSNPNWAPTEYANSHFWSFNGGNSSSTFWVLGLNNELWWSHYTTGTSPPVGTPFNPGPPNLSLPRVEPGLGIMGFKPIIWTEGGENFYRFHLVLNQVFTNPQGAGALPFMSIGAAHNRGNGGVIGYMNQPHRPSKVEWTSKVWDVLENNQTNYWASVHFLLTTAEWGGKTRMLFVALYHESNLNGAELHYSDSTNGTHNHWNWQMQESFFYPGADIALMDAEDIYALCGFSMTRLRNKDDSANYSVVLDDLYRCASDIGLFDTPMPGTAVPITGVHWANEGTGDNVALWTSVHNMRMSLPPDPCPLCISAPPTQPTESIYPPVAAFPNEVPNEVTLIAERLRSSCKASVVCWQENEQYLKGKLRERTENPNKYVGNLRTFMATVKDGK